jgi:hypothetical protein
MGMFNAIIPDDLLHATGVFKERLSQSALYYESTQVSEREARAVYRWLTKAGMKFHTGPDDATDLTVGQILQQCRVYIAAVRLADDFGCAGSASNTSKGSRISCPPATWSRAFSTTGAGRRSNHGTASAFFRGRTGAPFQRGRRMLRAGRLAHATGSHRPGQPVETTLHDLRWGDRDRSGTVEDYVWVFLISGSAPPAHFIGGWKGAEGFRQPPMYFPKGGSTLRGISKPGEIVWSRIFIEDHALHMDLGRAKVIKLPRSETERRWQATTYQWPIMHAVTYGVTRDQMMARHKANHIQVVYADDAAAADQALAVKASLAEALGMKVNLCGTRANGQPWD